jgi:hypothetical protein
MYTNIGLIQKLLLNAYVQKKMLGIDGTKKLKVIKTHIYDITFNQN